MGDENGFARVVSRALNYSRREHIATYAGLRMLVDSSVSSVWLKQYTERRHQTSRGQSFGTYSIYKRGAGKAIEYRDCKIPSPASLLVEVVALRAMASSPTFASHPSVYSYRWAAPEAKHVFQHFFEGYRLREVDVANACGALGESARIVMVDIKSYYHSVNRTRVAKELGELVTAFDLTVGAKDQLLFALAPYSNDRSEVGIPVGPPLSHAIAQMFLRQIDVRLEAAYPSRYFRYVDDLIVVCQATEVDRVRREMHDSITELGLTPNTDKDLVVVGETWIARVRATADTHDPFVPIAKIVRGWGDRVTDVDSLRTRLRGSGVSIPLVPVRERTAGLLASARRKIVDLFLGLRFNSFSQKLEQARDTLRTSLRRQQELKMPDEAVARKWRVQDVRFNANRLLQLSAEEEASTLFEEIPDLEELAGTRAVARSLATGDAGEIVSYPGHNVYAAARAWLSRTDRPMKLDSSAVRTHHQRNGAYMLMLYGVVDSSVVFPETGSRAEQAFAKFCGDRRVERREFSDFGYMDELQSLHMTAPEPSGAKLRTRHTTHEEIIDEDPFDVLY